MVDICYFTGKKKGGFEYGTLRELLKKVSQKNH